MSLTRATGMQAPTGFPPCGRAGQGNGRAWWPTPFTAA